MSLGSDAPILHYDSVACSTSVALNLTSTTWLYSQCSSISDGARSGPEVLFQDLRRDEICGWWRWGGDWI